MLGFINKKTFITMLFFAFVLIFCFGCSNTEIGNPDTSSLFSMNNDAELKTYLQDQYISDYEADYASGQSGDTSEIDKVPMPPEGNDAVLENGRIFIIYGNYNYEADYDRIIVSTSDSLGEEQIAVIETFDEITDLLISGDTLIVIQRITGSANLSEFNSNIQTGILFIDVSNPYDPEKLKEIQIDGQFMDSILKNEKLFIIQQFNADITGLDAGREEIKNEIEKYSLDSFIPYYVYLDDLRQPLGFIKLVEPDDLFRPLVPSGSTMTIVSLLNIKYIFDLPQSIGFIGKIDNISTSLNSVYLKESTGKVYEIDISGEKPVFADTADEI